ncbi:MAG: LytR/AlgR family response regulator transcription factor [Vicinamibacterales bacterium]
MTIRALVVDDQPMARERLVSLLAAEPDVVLAGAAASGLEAIDRIRQTSPDLVFLDLQMPELDGFGVIERIGVDHMPPTVFVTAYDEHAVRAFEVQALDYLLKPFGRQRFQSALQRARRHLERIEAGSLATRLAAVLRSIRTPAQSGERLLIKRGGRVSFVEIDQIDWVEADGNHVHIHVGAESYVLRETMASLLGRIGESRFFRIHRSRIVNLGQIKELRIASGADYEVVMRGGQRLRLSRLYREALQRQLSGCN